MPDDLARLLDLFAPGARLVRSWPLAGGISASMTAFEIERPDGSRERLIRRRPRAGRAGEEYRVLTALAATGLPVPPPRFLEPEEEGFVVGHLEGAPDLAPPDPLAYAARYADALAGVHRTGFEGLGLPTMDRGHGEPPDVSNHALREDEVRAALARFAEPPCPNPPALLHGDFWPGNVLWRKGRLAGILDWEEARVGEPMFDLAICRLDLLWIVGWEAVAALTARYAAATGADLRGLAYWDLCAALRPTPNLPEWAPSYPPLGRPDVTAGTMARDHGEFVAQALAAL